MTDDDGQSSDRVETLLEALPYIREFHGRTVVIKYGGAAMRDEALRDDFATDVVLLKYVGLNPVIVHGGGPDITSYMERLGMEVRFVRGRARLRPRDGRGGEDGPARQGQLRHRQPAQPPRPAGGRPLGRGRRAVRDPPARRRPSEVGFVGEIERVDVDVLNHIAEDYIPVIASAGADREGNSYNVNADTAAGKVAAALRAYKAIFLTDVEGWLADPADPDSLISRATSTRSSARSRRSTAGCGRSSPPASRRSAAASQSAHIVDGRRPHSLLLELFTDAGIGTMVTP